MQQKTFCSCPIDQLYLSGLLNSEEGETVAAIRYMAAKKLSRCGEAEFERVKRYFHHHESLIRQVISSPVLPSSSSKWLPALRDSLDSAAEFWGMDPTQMDLEEMDPEQDE
jgi:hypothetical protein